MSASLLLRHLLIKTAANPFGSMFKNFGHVAGDITPQLKVQGALPPVSAAIVKPPLPQLKPDLMDRVVRPPGGAPRLQSDPALEAKSVFRQPVGATQQPPVAPIVNKPAAEYHEQVPAPETNQENLIAQERDLAGRMKNPAVDPSSKVVMQDQLKKLYEQINNGPALQLSNPAGHAASLVARMTKIKAQRAAMLQELYREAEAPPMAANAQTTRRVQPLTPSPFY